MSNNNDSLRIWKILYIGIDDSTLLLLTQEKFFSVYGVNFIEDFLKVKTLNPFNLYFKLLYFLRIRNNHYYIEKLFVYFWKLFQFLSTSIFKKYAGYLSAISINRIKIIDLNQISAASKEIIDNDIDLAVVNNWWLLPNEIINAPKYKTVNIHPSILPQYAGSLPTLWSLRNKDKFSAVTYIIINLKMDRGDILNQELFTIDSRDNAIDLEYKIENIIRRTLISVVKKYLSGDLQSKPQSKKEFSKTAKYFDYMRIDFTNENALDIYNKVMLYPYLWPLDKCYFYFNKLKIVLKSVAIEKKEQLRLKESGDYYGAYFKLYIKTIDEVIVIRLFKDINFIDSIKFIGKHGKIS